MLSKISSEINALFIHILLVDVEVYYNSTMKKEISLKTGIYKHFKGNLYEVLDLGRDSETEEWKVIYRTLYGDGGTWIRPYEMFTESIEINGEVVQRFEYMGKN